MMRKLACLLALIIMLSGCTRETSPASVDILAQYETQLEAYLALFCDNRGAFISNYVVDDVHTRFLLVQLLADIVPGSVEEIRNGIYRIGVNGGQTFRLAFKYENEKIVSFEVRRDIP